MANVVAGAGGNRSEDTLNRSLIDLSPGESYCNRFPQWHSSLLSRFSQRSGYYSPFSPPHSSVPVFLLAFSSPSHGTRSLLRCIYSRSAYIRLCGKLLGGRRAYSGTCTARGEVAAAATAAAATATSGQSLVSRPSEQQAPRETRRASERSPLCARGQWARVGARRSTECECGPRAVSRCHCKSVIRRSSRHSCPTIIMFYCMSAIRNSRISLGGETLRYIEVSLNLIKVPHKEFNEFLCTAQYALALLRD